MNRDFVEGVANQKIISMFLKECTIEYKSSHVRFMALYSRFKLWFQDGFPSEKIPNRFVFKCGIEKFFAIHMPNVGIVEDTYDGICLID
jgi:hypothetical protein